MSGYPPSRYKRQEWILIDLPLLRQSGQYIPSSRGEGLMNKLMYRFVATTKKKKTNKMPILAYTRDAVADSFIPTVCLAD